MLSKTRECSDEMLRKRTAERAQKKRQGAQKNGRWALENDKLFGKTVVERKNAKTLKSMTGRSA